MKRFVVRLYSFEANVRIATFVVVFIYSPFAYSFPSNHSRIVDEITDQLSSLGLSGDFSCDTRRNLYRINPETKTKEKVGSLKLTDPNIKSVNVQGFDPNTKSLSSITAKATDQIFRLTKNSKKFKSASVEKLSKSADPKIQKLGAEFQKSKLSDDGNEMITPEGDVISMDDLFGQAPTAEEISQNSYVDPALNSDGAPNNQLGDLPATSGFTDDRLKNWAEETNKAAQTFVGSSNEGNREESAEIDPQGRNFHLTDPNSKALSVARAEQSSPSLPQQETSDSSSENIDDSASANRFAEDNSAATPNDSGSLSTETFTATNSEASSYQAADFGEVGISVGGARAAHSDPHSSTDANATESSSGDSSKSDLSQKIQNLAGELIASSTGEADAQILHQRNLTQKSGTQKIAPESVATVPIEKSYSAENRSFDLPPQAQDLNSGSELLVSSSTLRKLPSGIKDSSSVASPHESQSASSSSEPIGFTWDQLFFSLLLFAGLQQRRPSWNKA